MLDDYFLCTRLARQLMKLVTKRGSRTLAVLCLLGFTGSAGAPWQQQSTKANLQLVNTVPQSYDAQENFPPELMQELEAIKSAALRDDYAYRQLAYLTENIGPRPSGSGAAQ